MLPQSSMEAPNEPLETPALTTPVKVLTPRSTIDNDNISEKVSESSSSSNLSQA